MFISEQEVTGCLFSFIMTIMMFISSKGFLGLMGWTISASKSFSAGLDTIKL